MQEDSDSQPPQTSNTIPWWVVAAVGTHIKTSHGGAWLVWSCVISSLYCLPWQGLGYLHDYPAIDRLFLAPNWSWFAIMVPMTIWYWMAVRWMTKNRAWPR